MSKRLKKFAPLIKQLHKSTPAKRKKLLREQLNKKEFVHCVCECAKNLLKGKVPLSPSQKRSLRKKRNSLHRLAQRRVSLREKKKIIQKGGFLGALLGPIASVLGGLLGGLNSSQR
jgi:hypothetical protein